MSRQAQESQLPPPPPPEPPAHLSERAKALWKQIVPARGWSPGRLVLLQTALESLDRADEARSAVQAAGLTTVTARTGVIHVNPLVKIEREARGQFLATWGQLRLGFDVVRDGLPNNFLDRRATR